MHEYEIRCGVCDDLLASGSMPRQPTQTDADLWSHALCETGHNQPELVAGGKIRLYAVKPSPPEPPPESESKTLLTVEDIEEIRAAKEGTRSLAKLDASLELLLYKLAQAKP